MSDQVLLIISHKRHRLAPNGAVKVEGGFFAITNEFARHFRKVRLLVPCAPISNAEARERYSDNIEIIPLPAYENRLSLLRHSPRIVRRMYQEIAKADLVYTMGPNDFGCLGMMVAHLRKARFFASLDTDRAQLIFTRNYGFVTRYVKYCANRWLLYPLIYKLCKHVPVFVTGDLFLGKATAWRQWVKSTVRISDIPPMREPRLLTETDTAVIAFVGRLSREKNIGVLLEGAEQLSRKGRRVQLLIIGDGVEMNALREQAAKLGLNNVTFLGRKANAEVIASGVFGADVLVLPSREERQGKVLLEAMSCSVPVVAARAGGIPSVIDHGINGLLFDPSSSADLASALEGLLYSEISQRRTLVRNGYEFSRTHAMDVEVATLIADVRAWWESRAANLAGGRS